MPTKLRWFLLTVFAVIVVDQATKWWIVQNVELWRGGIDVIDGFFQIVHYRNKGAVGGMLGGSDHRLTIFFLFTIVALGAIGWMVKDLPKEDRFVAFCLGLIGGGAIGNAIDRATMGEVVDFLRFYSNNPDVVEFFAKYGMRAEYPSWNVADAGIVVGVLAFFVQQFFQDGATKEVELSPDELPPEEEVTPAGV